MEHLVLFIVLQRSKTTWTITHIRFFAHHEFYIEGASIHLYQKRLFRKLGVSSSSSIPRWRWISGYAETWKRSYRFHISRNHRPDREIGILKIRIVGRFARLPCTGLFENGLSVSAMISISTSSDPAKMELSNTSPPPPGHAWKKIVKFCTRWMGRSEVFVEWN